jgi:uncharacterized membrane protein YeaQ/YmgE (transglycosylase-associated protein family)
MWNLLVFALIGLLAGAGARLLYPGRQPLQILGTIALGILGGLGGGMLSWMNWPDVDGQFQLGNLVASLLGAMLVIVLGVSITYARSLSEKR